MHASRYHSRLMGRLAQGGASRAHCVDDIVAHLQVLLNTRQGASPARQDYGLTDLLPLLRALPESRPALCERLRATIADFEPRLCNIRVSQSPSVNTLVVQFDIVAELRRDNTSIALTTRVMGDERLRVSS